MLKSSARILIAAAALFAAAPAFAADEVDCILNKFSPAQYEALALKSISDLVSDEAVDEGAGPGRDAAIAFGRYSDECDAEHDWSQDQEDAAGDYTLLALAAHGSRILLERKGVPVAALDQYYAGRPDLRGMQTPPIHVAAGPQHDAWSNDLIADMRKAGIALPEPAAALVPSYIALMAWRDQRKAEFAP